MVGVGKITQETDFIVGNPQITFFKAVYRRHSHFAIQQKTQSGDQPNVNGKEIVYTINDGGGQLLHRCWLEVDLNVTNTNIDSEEYMNWTNNTGHAFVEQCKLKINNNEIDTHCYFVHSYQFNAENSKYITGKCSYGDEITAIVEKDNIYGVQFHPEKSHATGLKILNNFISLKC